MVTGIFHLIIRFSGDIRSDFGYFHCDARMHYGCIARLVGSVQGTVTFSVIIKILLLTAFLFEHVLQKET